MRRLALLICNFGSNIRNLTKKVFFSIFLWFKTPSSSSPSFVNRNIGIYFTLYSVFHWKIPRFYGIIVFDNVKMPFRNKKDILDQIYFKFLHIWSKMPCSPLNAIFSLPRRHYRKTDVFFNKTRCSKVFFKAETDYEIQNSQIRQIVYVNGTKI